MIKTVLVVYDIYDMALLVSLVFGNKVYINIKKEDNK